MLIDNATSATSKAPIDVGLTALRVAVARAKVFEKSIEERSDRQEKESKVLAEETADRRQRVRENLAQARSGVDIVIERNDSLSSTPAPEAASASKGGEVDIEV